MSKAVKATPTKVYWCLKCGTPNEVKIEHWDEDTPNRQVCCAYCCSKGRYQPASTNKQLAIDILEGQVKHLLSIVRHLKDGVRPPCLKGSFGQNDLGAKGVWPNEYVERVHVDGGFIAVPKKEKTDEQ